MGTSNESAVDIRIIVVDDNPDWCNTIKLMSKMLKTVTVTETVMAHTIKDAIDVIREAQVRAKPFSVAIIDMQFDAKDDDDKSGKTLIRFIKREHPYIACIIATGQSLTPEYVLDLRDDYDLDYCLSKDDISIEVIAKSISKGLKRIQRKGADEQQSIAPVSGAPLISTPISSSPTVFSKKPEIKSAPKVFISYSHKDSLFKDELVTMLASLQRRRVIEAWQDCEIQPGDEWYQAIQEAMNTSHLALFLISPDFLASKFIVDEEIPRLLQRRTDEGMRAIPIIVRKCMWQKEPVLKDLQALPKGGKPVITFPKETGERDDAWTEIAEAIEMFAKKLA